MNKETKGIVSLVANLVLPGAGTLIEGNVTIGVIQIVLYCVGAMLAFLLIGIPIMLGVWLWAVISSAMKLKEVSK